MSYFKASLQRFRSHKRGYYSFVMFVTIFLLTSFAELVANNKPIILYINDTLYFPAYQNLREIDLGGDYINNANFNDPYVQELVSERGFSIMPPINYRFDTVVYNLDKPSPTPPTTQNWLGTDDMARDILARLIYGLRISIFFALILTFASTIIGIAYGAIQGYKGGITDVLLQRVYEIWSSLPSLYILIILSSIIVPSLFWLLSIMLLFSWLSLVTVVRAEFYKVRNYEFVLAAKALGVSNFRIVLRHILPNALVATLTYVPFLVNASITSLTALDFLGLGLPPGTPSLGEMLAQAKNNLHAKWIALSVFFTLSGIMVLMVFIGEAIRDAFDPRSNL